MKCYLLLARGNTLFRGPAWHDLWPRWPDRSSELSYFFANIWLVTRWEERIKMRHEYVRCLFDIKPFSLTLLALLFIHFLFIHSFFIYLLIFLYVLILIFWRRKWIFSLFMIWFIHVFLSFFCVTSLPVSLLHLVLELKKFIVTFFFSIFIVLCCLFPSPTSKLDAGLHIKKKCFVLFPSSFDIHLAIYCHNLKHHICSKFLFFLYSFRDVDNVSPKYQPTSKKSFATT